MFESTRLGLSFGRCRITERSKSRMETFWFELEVGPKIQERTDQSEQETMEESRKSTLFLSLQPFTSITNSHTVYALLTSTFLPFQVSEKIPMISAEDLFIVIELLLSHNVCVQLMETIFYVRTHFFLGGNWNTPLQFTQLETVYRF